MGCKKKMYASTKDSIPLMEQKGSSSVVNLNNDEFLNNPFGFDKGNNQFWDSVSLDLFLFFLIAFYNKKTMNEISLSILSGFFSE